MADISKISSGGIVYDVKDKTARENNEILCKQTNYLNQGRNLADIFNAEIAHYTDEWEWMKDRISSAFFSDLMVRDYIPFQTTNNETVLEQIAGIDTYYNTTDVAVPHHIDFISKDCLAATVKWNEENNNNGNAESAYPYMVSNVKKYLLETVLPTIPEKIRKQLANKRFLMEQRFSASGALTDSTGWGWQDLGLLWLCTEYEVFGSVVWGTKGWSAGQAVQYPIFANNWLDRIKGAGNGGSRCLWWLASVGSGNSTLACGVYYYGYANHWIASYARRVPVCFRITA